MNICTMQLRYQEKSTPPNKINMFFSGLVSPYLNIQIKA